MEPRMRSYLSSSAMHHEACTSSGSAPHSTHLPVDSVEDRFRLRASSKRRWRPFFTRTPCHTRSAPTRPAPRPDRTGPSDRLDSVVAGGRPVCPAPAQGAQFRGGLARSSNPRMSLTPSGPTRSTCQRSPSPSRREPDEHGVAVHLDVADGGDPAPGLPPLRVPLQDLLPVLAGRLGRRPVRPTGRPG